MSEVYTQYILKAMQGVFREYEIKELSTAVSEVSPQKYVETKGIDILVYFVQDLEGMVIISTEEDTASTLAKKIDIDPENVTPETVREIMAEIGNLTAARASGLFSNNGIETNITPPSIFCGAGSQIYSMVPNLMITTMETEVGKIWLHSAIRRRHKHSVYLS